MRGPLGQRMSCSHCPTSRWTWVLTALLCGFWTGCGPIPTDSDGDVQVGQIDSERVYENDEWGFQITIPGGNEWGFTAQTSYRQREANGLPWVRVVISKNVDASGTGVRPSLTLRPRAVSAGTSADILATIMETDFKSIYLGYTPRRKRSLNLAPFQSTQDSVRAVDWEFTTMLPVGAFNRFFAAAVIDEDDRGYTAVGTGNQNVFPVDEYRQIIATLRFTR